MIYADFFWGVKQPQLLRAVIVAGEDQRDKRKRTTDDVSQCIGWRQNWELGALQDESRRDL